MNYFSPLRATLFNLKQPRREAEKEFFILIESNKQLPNMQL